MRNLITCVLFILLAATGTVAEEATRHTFKVDGNKVAVWEKRPAKPRRAILLLHGRTWSSLPAFDFRIPGENHSLMDALVAKGYVVYALDQPGYGGLPRDKSGWFSPSMGVANIAKALKWIHGRHRGLEKPIVAGWSLGSTMALLTAQKYPDLVSDLVLFGYWRDLDVPVKDDPIIKLIQKSETPLSEANTPKQAAEDFVAPNAMSKRATDGFVKAALKADPIRMDIRNLEEFGEINPKRINTPVLLIQGEFDGILKNEGIARLFTRLAHPDRQWVMLAGGDHAMHMGKTQGAFMAAMTAFIERPKLR